MFCCRWCSDMFIVYIKAFFSQDMSDGKVGGPIEKSHLRGIIYDIAVLTFLTLETSQKSFDITDFFYFEETFRSE